MGTYDERAGQDRNGKTVSPPRYPAAFQRPLSDLQPPLPVVMDVEESVQDALNFMQLKQMGCVLVTRRMVLAGILTERDIMAKALGQEADLNAIRVEEIMTPDPVTFSLCDPLGAVMTAMSTGDYRHVPIVDAENQPVGIISVKDILRHIVKLFIEESKANDGI